MLDLCRPARFGLCGPVRWLVLGRRADEERVRAYLRFVPDFGLCDSYSQGERSLLVFIILVYVVFLDLDKWFELYVEIITYVGL